MFDRAIAITGLDHARAALRAASDLGMPVALLCASPALGAQAFLAMVRAAREEFPDAEVLAVMDCGDEPGRALNAFRHGVRAVRVDLAPEVLARVRDIAGQYGAALWEGEVLEGSEPTYESCRDRLARLPGGAGSDKGGA